MNDKISAENTAPAFDPAANGWEKLTGIGFGELIGPLWKRQDGDRLRFGFTVVQKHLNRAGNLHGGMLMTFADQAMAMTGREATGGKRHATMELNIQFIGAAHLGEFVAAHPEVVRLTRSVIFLQVKMYVGDRIVVSSNGIWKIIGAP
jgi:uncharacterized protein (TIGR00369 family)